MYIKCFMAYEKNGPQRKLVSGTNGLFQGNWGSAMYYYIRLTPPFAVQEKYFKISQPAGQVLKMFTKDGGGLRLRPRTGGLLRLPQRNLARTRVRLQVKELSRLKILYLCPRSPVQWGGRIGRCTRLSEVS